MSQIPHYLVELGDDYCWLRGRVLGRNGLEGATVLS